MGKEAWDIWINKEASSDFSSSPPKDLCQHVQFDVCVVSKEKEGRSVPVLLMPRRCAPSTCLITAPDIKSLSCWPKEKWPLTWWYTHTHTRPQTKHTQLRCSAGVSTNPSAASLRLFSGWLGSTVNNEPPSPVAALRTQSERQRARYSEQRYVDTEIRLDSVIHFTHLPLSSYLFICPLLPSVSLGPVCLESRCQSRRASVPEKTPVQRSVKIRATALKDHVQLELSHPPTSWECNVSIIPCAHAFTMICEHNPLLSIRKQLSRQRKRRGKLRREGRMRGSKTKNLH